MLCNLSFGGGGRACALVAFAAVAIGCSSSEGEAPKAPKLDEVIQMVGGLHITWTNTEPSCDAVEGERQAQTADGAVKEAYKVVFSVPGAADNKHDATASEDMKYTYRLRCKKGSAYSAYSNELSGNPMK